MGWQLQSGAERMLPAFRNGFTASRRCENPAGRQSRRGETWQKSRLQQNFNKSIPGTSAGTVSSGQTFTESVCPMPNILKHFMLIIALSAFSLPGRALDIGLGIASNYSAFVFSSITASNGSSGALAAGSSTLSSFGANGGVESGLDFATAYAQLSGLSQTIAGLQASGNTSRQGNGFSLTGTGNSLEVFNLSASDLHAGYYTFSNIASGATVILNISGSQIARGASFFQTDFLKQNAPQTDRQLLLNFYQASTLDIGNAEVNAAILAPDAAASFNEGTFRGNLVAQSLTVSRAGLNTSAFQTVSVSPVPEPATWAMLLGGLGLIGSLVRRRL